MKVVLGVDHGTTRTKALAVDSQARVIAQGSAALPLLYPQPGWVEQDPAAILATTSQAVEECLERLPPDASVAGIGLANQGETVLVWDRHTGRAVYPAIVWQDRRTADACARLARNGWADQVRARTGLLLDPYFSASKVRWILDHIPDGQARAEVGDLLLGTTDSWLLWHLSSGRMHVTDATTASRTLLLNLRTLEWDEQMLTLFDVPRPMLPSVLPCIGQLGEITPPGLSEPVALVSLAADQQAALFGHGCRAPGMMKATYGTGTFALMHTGSSPRTSPGGLLATLAWTWPGETAYALDGGVYTTGAAVEWLVQGLGILERPEDSAAVAASVADSGGVFMVPALSGLAAPYWDPNARGVLVGLTRGTTRAHVVRSVLEGIALRVRDVVIALEEVGGFRVPSVRVDGGPTRNAFLMQLQADVLDVPVEVAATADTTGRGVALLAGVALGWWTPDEAAASWQAAVRYEPCMPASQRDRLGAGWADAIQRATAWSQPGTA